MVLTPGPRRRGKANKCLQVLPASTNDAVPRQSNHATQQQLLVSHDPAHLPHRGIDHLWLIRDTDIVHARRVPQGLDPVRCWTLNDSLIKDREIKDLRRFDC